MPSHPSLLNGLSMQTDTTPDLETEKGGVAVFTLALKIKGPCVSQGHGKGRTGWNNLARVLLREGKFWHG